jgi:hydroxyacylglutathione hydrolase
VAEVVARQRQGAVVLDTRDDGDFALGHLAGSVNVGLGGRFAEYAGEVVRAGTPIVVVAEPDRVSEAVVRLGRIGFDTVAGYLKDPYRSFQDHPEAVVPRSRLTVAELVDRQRDVVDLQLVDVRSPGEMALGMIPGAQPLPLPELLSRLGELDPARPTVVHCAGGYRSSIAASLLAAHGFADVFDLLGGYTAWLAAAAAERN